MDHISSWTAEGQHRELIRPLIRSLRKQQIQVLIEVTEGLSSLLGSLLRDWGHLNSLGSVQDFFFIYRALYADGHHGQRQPAAVKL